MLQYAYTWLILQLCGILARLVPSETQFRGQTAPGFERREKDVGVGLIKMVLKFRIPRLCPAHRPLTYKVQSWVRRGITPLQNPWYYMFRVPDVRVSGCDRAQYWVFCADTFISHLCSFTQEHEQATFERYANDNKFENCAIKPCRIHPPDGTPRHSLILGFGCLGSPTILTSTPQH